MKDQILTKAYQPKHDYLRVAAATPQVETAALQSNAEHILKLYSLAAKQNVSLVVFPELSITGYTLEDLVMQTDLLASARQQLVKLAAATKQTNSALVVGLPLMVGSALYNCAAFLAGGLIVGIVPKQRLPSFNEFYEKRWYQTWGDRPNITITVGRRPVPFGTKQLFDIDGALIGLEICEDLWEMESPHEYLAKNGGLIVVNPSASPETAAKADYRRGLVKIASAKAALGYVYTSADPSESTANVVMSGHAIIAENGRIIAERQPLTTDSPRLLIADIDLAHLRLERRRNTSYPNEHTIVPFKTNLTKNQSDLRRTINPTPFVPKGSSAAVSERLETILNIQAHGLARRLQNTPNRLVVLGLSGGLDSTLALIVAVRAAQLLDRSPGQLIHTLTMPAQASSGRTQTNAVKLATSLGLPNEQIPIDKLLQNQLESLNHDSRPDVTYENTQARIRQALIFNKANQLGGLALGTGDMSEAALGWCTYGGDQTSGYHVNASIPKTLVRSLVVQAAAGLNQTTRNIIDDILATPVSPELIGGDLSQVTEDIIGPYELHDFFLYHFLRWQDSPSKIRFLAIQAFESKYDQATIDKYLQVFRQRFYQNQWKRQTMPDGPKVGLSLNPRGDWRMPPDIKYTND